eukprot:TRINITY_DN19019_c0_g1_i1.p1 TRINITY_DN19019_c0_g1~~TRINITY_DN19019_c0_g1_i1.p1  ORF type:complete len:289 (+),score=82.50 TRINITY_DN19019_c0_g1_i1:67-867(+)
MPRAAVGRLRPLLRRQRRLAASAAAPDLAEAWGILGMDPIDEMSAVKARYKQLAMLLHPDRGGEPGMMLQLNEAFSVVSECILRDADPRPEQPQKRQQQPPQPPPEPPGGAQREAGGERWNPFDDAEDGPDESTEAGRQAKQERDERRRQRRQWRRQRDSGLKWRQLQRAARRQHQNMQVHWDPPVGAEEDTAVAQDEYELAREWDRAQCAATPGAAFVSEVAARCAASGSGSAWSSGDPLDDAAEWAAEEDPVWGEGCGDDHEHY